MNDPFAEARRRREEKQRQEEIERQRQEQLRQQRAQDREKQQIEAVQKQQQNMQELARILEEMKVYEKLAYMQQVAWRGCGNLEFIPYHYEEAYGNLFPQTGWQLSFAYHQTVFSISGGWKVVVKRSYYSGAYPSSVSVWRPEGKHLDTTTWQEALGIYCSSHGGNSLSVTSYQILISGDKPAIKNAKRHIAFIELNDLVVAEQLLDDALFEYIEKTKDEPSPIEKQKTFDIQSQQAIQEYNSYKPRIREPGK